MARADIDTDLLFGILALQVGVIEQANPLDAFQGWSRDKTRRLAQILVDRGALGPADRTMLEDLVGRHLEKHGGDAELSLAAVAAAPAAPRSSTRDQFFPLPFAPTAAPR